MKKPLQESVDRFESGAFHIALRDPAFDPRRKLASLAYLMPFIVAFRDAMSRLQAHTAKDAIGRAVARHAAEDGDHWQWFVHDVSWMHAQGYVGAFQDYLWSTCAPSSMPVRDASTQLHRFLDQHDGSAARYLLIQVLEITSRSFQAAVAPVVQALGLFETLRFFGAVHMQAESEHEMEMFGEDFDAVAASVPVERRPQLTHDLVAMVDALTQMLAAALQLSCDARKEAAA